MAISNKLPCWFPTLLSTNGISRCLSLTVMSNQNFWSSRHFRCKQQMSGQNRFLGFCSFMFPFDIAFHFLKSECERVSLINWQITSTKIRPWANSGHPSVVTWRGILSYILQFSQTGGIIGFTIHRYQCALLRHSKAFRQAWDQTEHFQHILVWKIQRMETMKIRWY